MTTRKQAAIGLTTALLNMMLAPAGATADSDRLETVVVRAAREPVASHLSGSAIRLFDSGELERRQTASLADILRASPGVAVSRSGVTGAQTQLRLRGGESNHVLVFIDGIRANDPAQNSEFNFAHLLNTELESVEIIRGPQSALWGSDALSGVINIKTRRTEQGLDGRVFSEGGSNGWRHFGAAGGYGDERLQFGFDVSDLHSDGENISRRGGEEDGYENTTANGRASITLGDALRLDGNLRYVDATNEFDGVDFSTGLPADSADRTDVEQLYARVGANLATLGGRWRHSLALALTDTDNRNRSENPFALTGFDRYRSDAEVTTLTLQTSLDVADGHTLTAAWERIDEDFRQRGPVGFADPNRDEEMKTDSLIAEYRANLTESLFLQTSLRHDDNSDFDDKTTGRVSASWRPQQTTTLRGAWGTGVKNPTFTERFGFFTDFIGNPDLKPEQSTGWEVGIDQSLLKDRLQLSVTWFDEALEDEINGFVFDPASGGFTAENENGNSNREGLELSARWQIARSLTLSSAYTWLDAREDDPAGGQVDEIRRARHIGNVNLDWVGFGDRANLNLNVDYNGRQDDLFFPPSPPYRERVELDDFVLVTLAGRYRVRKNLDLFARLENVLDETYEEVVGYVGPGRSVIAGFRFRFSPAPVR